MTITFYSAKSYDKSSFEDFGAAHNIRFLETSLDEKSAVLAKGSECVCLFVSDRASGPVIRALAENGVRLLALRSAGFNHVDLVAAEDAGITVVRVPAYSPHAVAEHAVALLLTLNRKTHKAYNRVRDGNFSLERLIGFDLFGKTVGVVGTGKIGSAFCEIMLGFGCRVVAFDPFENDGLRQKGVQYGTLPELLAASDIVSLHCPLTEQTRHLINEKSLETMKTGAMLLNTGRGGLVDSRAVVAALKSKKLGHLGLDVYEQEEKLFSHDLSETLIDDELILRLMTFPNVLITAHQAYLTEEALAEIARVTIENIDAFAEGRVLENQLRG